MASPPPPGNQNISLESTTRPRPLGFRWASAGPRALFRELAAVVQQHPIPLALLVEKAVGVLRGYFVFRRNPKKTDKNRRVRRSPAFLAVPFPFSSRNHLLKKAVAFKENDGDGAQFGGFGITQMHLPARIDIEPTEQRWMNLLLVTRGVEEWTLWEKAL